MLICSRSRVVAKGTDVILDEIWNGTLREENRPISWHADFLAIRKDIDVVCTWRSNISIWMALLPNAKALSTFSKHGGLNPDAVVLETGHWVQGSSSKFAKFTYLSIKFRKPSAHYIPAACDKKSEILSVNDFEMHAKFFTVCSVTFLRFYTTLCVIGKSGQVV